MISEFVHEKDRNVVHWLAKSRVDFYIAGGACLNWYQNQPVQTDIDLFFPNHSEYEKMNRYIRNRGKAQEYMFGEFTSVEKHISENADTWELRKWLSQESNTGPYTVQCIKINKFPSAEQLIDSFDISVCQIAFRVSGQARDTQLTTSKYFAEDVRDSRLRFTKIMSGSAKRLVKYWSYGFTPDDKDVDLICDNKEIDWVFDVDEYGS